MNKILAIITVIALAGAGYYLYTSQTEPNNVDSGNVTQNPTTQTYTNDSYGITFQYPTGYRLTEENASKAGQEIMSVVLISEADLPLPVNGEGPTAITIDFYRYDSDEQTPENWIRKANTSNFQLSTTGELKATEVGGAAALSYTWDGLYRGDSVVFAHEHDQKKTMVMMSVTYMSPEDKIRTDFTQILSSVELN